MGIKPRGERHTIEAAVEFLNVDLELEGPSDLAPLIAALGEVFVLHRSTEAPFVASLEVEPGVGMDFETTVRALLDLIEGLDDASLGRWDECSTRRFNVGIQSGLEPHCSQYALSTPLLRRLAAVDADLVVTVYGARYESTT